MCFALLIVTLLQLKRNRLKAMNRIQHPTIVLLALSLLCLTAGCRGRHPKTATGNPTEEQDTVPVDTALQARLKAYAAKPRVSGRFAYTVFDLTADKEVYSLNSGQMLPTASCMKLVTGIAAQHLLGQNYKYDTYLFTKGNITDGVLNGTVTFKAGLDPQLTPPDLKMFAKKLKSLGVRKIQGKLLFDLMMTEPVKAEVHWYPWDLNFSKYGILYKGSKRIMRDFKYTLRSTGISVADSCIALGRVPAGSTCRFRYRRPVSAIIRKMWKNSSNTQSTGLLFTIGHKYRPADSMSTAGVEYLRKFMREEVGRKDSCFATHDGCGLCPYDKMTSSALVSVLRYGYRHKSVYYWLNRMLPLSGVDGTLRREMYGPKTRGRIRAKTGTLSHPVGISTLAGYCTGSNGHQLCFAIMACEMSVLDARVYQRQLCEEMVKEDKKHP